MNETEYEDLSGIMLQGVRTIIDQLGKEGWENWTTSGMRTMTNGLLNELLEELTLNVLRMNLI